MRIHSLQLGREFSKFLIFLEGTHNSNRITIFAASGFRKERTMLGKLHEFQILVSEGNLNICQVDKQTSQSRELPGRKDLQR